MAARGSNSSQSTKHFTFTFEWSVGFADNLDMKRGEDRADIKWREITGPALCILLDVENDEFKIIQGAYLNKRWRSWGNRLNAWE